MNAEEVLALLTLVARLQSLNVRYETTIAQLQGELRDAKAALAEATEKPKPARNGRKAVTADTEAPA